MMKKALYIFLFLSFLTVSTANAGSIQYIGNGKGGPEVKIAYSRSNGDKWEHKTLKPGQTFHVPKDATHLQINGSPRDPHKNYKVKDGHVF